MVQGVEHLLSKGEEGEKEIAKHLLFQLLRRLRQKGCLRPGVGELEASLGNVVRS
jgi:hypothetical protein